jgi:hypothetical protein
VALIHHCGKKGAAICPSDLHCMFHMFDYFGVSFYLAFILLGFCVSHFNFRRGCLKKGKTKLGSVVDQLYCPFRTTQKVVGGMLLPLCVIAPWVSVSLLLYFYACPSRVFVGSWVTLRCHAFTRTRLWSLTRNIVKHKL